MLFRLSTIVVHDAFSRAAMSGESLGTYAETFLDSRPKLPLAYGLYLESTME